MFKINLVGFCKSGFSHLNIEVEAAFVDSSVNWIWYNTTLKLTYMLGLVLLE